MKSVRHLSPIAICCCVLSALAGILSTPASAQTITTDKNSFKANEILVKFKNAATDGQMFALNSKKGGTLVRKFRFINWQQIRLPQGVSVADVLAFYQNNPLVESAEPNYRVRAVSTPNDPSFGTQWDMTKIQAPAAWDKTTGSKSVVVAVIDTGVDYNHPDLAANMWHNPGEIPNNGIDDDGDGYVDDVYGIDAANADSDPIDDEDHGTHCAGSIGAVGNNGVGISGVNWNVKIMALKFMDSSGGGYTSDAITCLNYAILMKNRGVNVVATSNSWGGGGFSQALKNAFDAASNAGILSAVAAGNESSNDDTTPSYPASFTTSGIISVAASDSSDNRPSWSNYGATSVDLAAPGVNIYSTVRSTEGTGYDTYSGTSMATPHVAGAIALLAAYSGSSSATQIKAALMSGVDVLPQWQGKVVSNGRLNLLKAMNALTPSTPIPTVRRQSDLTIRNSSEDVSSASGDNLYNTDATNQNRSQTVSNTATATYFIDLQNDGEADDSFTVKANATPANWGAKYFIDSSNTDISSSVVSSGGWNSGTLASGASTRLRVEITPGASVAGNAVFADSMTATSTNDTTKTDTVKATTSTPAPVVRTYGVDASVRNSGDANFTGDGIVNTTASGQSVSQNVTRASTATFYVRLRNSGNTSDTIKLSGTRGASTWAVKYFDANNTDITTSVGGGTWRSPALAGGATYDVRVQVTPSTRVSIGSHGTVQLTATSLASSSKRDVVRATTNVVSSTATTHSLEAAPLTIKAAVAGRRIVLDFGSAGVNLDPDGASDAGHYTILLNGASVDVKSASFEQSGGLVILETGATLQSGSSCVVTFDDLPTLTGDAVSGNATCAK